MPDDRLSDTQRMLQPQGLFSAPRPFEPQPWPGSGGSASLFAPPLPGGQPPAGGAAQDGVNQTLPGGMQPVPPGAGGPWAPAPGGPYPPGSPYPPGGPYPGGPYPGGPYPPARRPPWSRLPKGPLTPAIIAAVLVLVVAAAILAAQRGGSGPGTAVGGTPGAGPAATASASALAERQAATRLAALLPQSGADRGAVIDAATDVQSCGKNIARDARTFSRAAANRRSLLSRLGTLPGRAALPAAMVTDLTGAWQASAQADTDLARWAQDMAGGCSKHKAAGDPNLKASFGPDGQATAGKQAFTRLWNPLARKYGLKTYQVGDL